MKNKKFTKDDLKVGYVVKTRDGILSMIMPVAGGELVIVDKNQGWIPVDRYDKCLCLITTGGLYDNPDPGYDIMEVYGFSKYSREAYILSTYGRELLWKREPEMTCDRCAHKVVCPHVGMCEHFMAKAE